MNFFRFDLIYSNFWKKSNLNYYDVPSNVVMFQGVHGKPWASPEKSEKIYKIFRNKMKSEEMSVNPMKSLSS